MGHRKTVHTEDRVRVLPTAKCDPNLRGKEGEVKFIRSGGHAYPVEVRLDGMSFNVPFTQKELEIVRKNGGPFVPGIDGEIKDAERRSSRLRALRRLANDLGYTLVKNAA